MADEKRPKMTRAALQALASEQLGERLGTLEIVSVVGGIRLDLVDSDGAITKVATFSTMAIAREAIPAMADALRIYSE